MIKLKALIVENIDSEIEMLKKYMKAGGERTTKIDSTIKSLYSKKSKYSKELKPISGEVYRKTAISKKDLKKLKIAKRDDAWLFLKMKYKSRRPVQSFTYNFDLAQKFAKYNAKPDYRDFRAKRTVTKRNTRVQELVTSAQTVLAPSIWHSKVASPKYCSYQIFEIECFPVVSLLFIHLNSNQRPHRERLP